MHSVGRIPGHGPAPPGIRQFFKMVNHDNNLLFILLSPINTILIISNKIPGEQDPLHGRTDAIRIWRDPKKLSQLSLSPELIEQGAHYLLTSY